MISSVYESLEMTQLLKVERVTTVPQQGDLRLSGPPSGQGAGSGARTRDRRVPADLRADSQATVLPTPPYKRRKKKKKKNYKCFQMYDNATPHSANLTQQWLQRYGWEILPHPAHSPDLAPSDFHLFGPLKRHLGGMAFETEDDLISELRNWFDNLDVDFFRVGINSLLSRWQKCIDLHGDYVEK
ncbi:histone-lysine N-methyltransferase SETMAR [Plakobranchus ocellatus]|uniref:Histone-lysine N-methyltransferase SETMAR n=1 Tax=Plakobranchus ocellatus TaxID=259542 RepID=A0AAV4AFQ4_9GAST|nr:histone-lysine N-methyltransferase SETMAR [Plakobranchus ocellatus]